MNFAPIETNTGDTGDMENDGYCGSHRHDAIGG